MWAGSIRARNGWVAGNPHEAFGFRTRQQLQSYSCVGDLLVLDHDTYAN
jgi:hypothetical protein